MAQASDTWPLRQSNEQTLMTRSTDHDARLTQLEIKACFMDDLLDRLDAVIVQQQAQIDRLTHEVQHLRQASADSMPAARNLRDELPPHY
jgi:SlyX protein